MKKKQKQAEPVNVAPLDIPGLDRVAKMGMGFTVLDDKVIIICDKSFANRLLSSRRDKGLPPS